MIDVWVIDVGLWCLGDWCLVFDGLINKYIYIYFVLMVDYGLLVVVVVSGVCSAVVVGM